MGLDITHLLFKDIAHNFLDQNEETRQLLQEIFDYEDAFIGQKNTSDAVFGIYRKKGSNGISGEQIISM